MTARPQEKGRDTAELSKRSLRENMDWGNDFPLTSAKTALYLYVYLFLFLSCKNTHYMPLVRFYSLIFLKSFEILMFDQHSFNC